MPSLKSLVAATLLAGSVVVAQNSTADRGTPIDQIVATHTQDIPSWCSSQFSICSALCGGFTSQDSCDYSTLNWTCKCQDASIIPDIESYENTIPYYICITRLANCIVNYTSSQVGQAACRDTFDCSTKDSANITAPSTSSSGTPSATTKPSGSSTAATGSPTPTKGAAIRLGQDYGMGIFAVVVLGAMGLLF